MKFCVAAMFFLSLVSACAAQEQEDYSEKVSPIKGGAVYDEKIGVDGTLIADEYILTHLVCSKGSRQVRMMLPLGLEDDRTFFTMDGAPSSLVKTRDGYRFTFKAHDKNIVKDVALKPTNDKASHYKAQFVVALDKGDALWRAMAAGKAVAMIGTGGTPVALPSGKRFAKFLAHCGL